MESVSIRVIRGLKCDECDEICVYLRYLRFLRATVRCCDDFVTPSSLGVFVVATPMREPVRT